MFVTSSRVTPRGGQSKPWDFPTVSSLRWTVLGHECVCTEIVKHKHVSYIQYAHTYGILATCKKRSNAILFHLQYIWSWETEVETIPGRIIIQRCTKLIPGGPKMAMPTVYDTEDCIWIYVRAKNKLLGSPFPSPRCVHKEWEWKQD